MDGLWVVPKPVCFQSSGSLWRVHVPGVLNESEDPTGTRSRRVLAIAVLTAKFDNMHEAGLSLAGALVGFVNTCGNGVCMKSGIRLGGR